MDWLRTIAPLSRHGFTASACLVGALGMSTFALAAEAPSAPLTEQELAAESYQVDFKPPASGDKAKKQDDKKEAEHGKRGEHGKHGDHAKRGEHGKRGEHAERGEHDKRGEHGDKKQGDHRGFGKPGMHHPGFGGRGFGQHGFGQHGFSGHPMHGKAMHHGFGSMHGGFGPGHHGKSQRSVGSHRVGSHGMQGPHMAMMHQQRQINALEQKVERLANAIRGGKPEMKSEAGSKPEHRPGHGPAGMHGMPGNSHQSVMIQHLMTENAQLKQHVARLEDALKSGKPAEKKAEAKQEDTARRPSAAGPRGPMMRGEGGPRGPIARGPRDGQRPQMGPRDGQRPQAGPRDGERDGERRERGERDGDRKEKDRRSENNSESREGFALDTNGDGFNDAPAEVVAIEIAVVDAE